MAKEPKIREPDTYLRHGRRLICSSYRSQQASKTTLYAA